MRESQPSTTIDTRATPISVVIVDDHDVVALGLGALLDDCDDIEVLGTARTVAESIDTVRRRRPHVVLMDYGLPDGTGADATRAIRALDDPPAVVMITSTADRRVLGHALDAGCCGFVSKHGDRNDLIHAIEAAAAGESYFTRDVLKHLVHLHRFDDTEYPNFSDRECEVLQLTANGLMPDEIASRLHLSPHTVRNHIRNVMAKLGAHTKLDAVVRAVRARIISIES